MDRFTFLKTCGLACIGSALAVGFLEGCGTTKRVSAVIEGSDILVPLAEFAYERDKERFHAALVLQNDSLRDPICVSRLNDGTTYAAVLMHCTHQGAQLQLFGDKLQCPAHGSEFDMNGRVQQGPAESPLRNFPVQVESHQLRISLR